MDSPYRRPGMRSCAVCFLFCLSKRWNKLSSCRWYEMVWRSDGITLIAYLRITVRFTKYVNRLGWINFSLVISWWRHQMETFPALLSICAGNSPVTGEFPAQRPVTRSFDVSLICAWVNTLEAGDLRRRRTHYGVTVMLPDHFWMLTHIL